MASSYTILPTAIASFNITGITLPIILRSLRLSKNLATLSSYYVDCEIGRKAYLRFRRRGGYIGFTAMIKVGDKTNLSTILQSKETSITIGPATFYSITCISLSFQKDIESQYISCTGALHYKKTELTPT